MPIERLAIKHPRPLSHFVIAYSFFLEKTGCTPDAVLGITDNSPISAAKAKQAHRRFYNKLLEHDRDEVEAQLVDRFARRKLSWDQIKDNMRGMPSSVPQTHKVILMRFLLNGLPISKRMRFVNNNNQILNCPFCEQVECDSAEHWCDCPTLHATVRQIIHESDHVQFHSDICHLQVRMQGRQLQVCLPYCTLSGDVGA